MAAIDDLKALLVNLPSAPLVTDSMYNDALGGSLMPDSFGVWPGEDGYETTYDIYFAALGLIGFLRAQPVVRQSSSEGTSVAVDAPDWGGLLAWYKSMSPIVRRTGNPVLTPVAIPQPPAAYHSNMHDGSFGNDDVDTDVS